MNVPRNIALPIVLTMCALTAITACFSFVISAGEPHQLEHLRDLNKSDLPGLTEFYSHNYGLGFVLPALNWPVGLILLRQPDCGRALLTWCVCLSLLAIVLWSLYSYMAVHVGFISFTFYM